LETDQVRQIKLGILFLQLKNLMADLSLGKAHNADPPR